MSRTSHIAVLATILVAVLSMASVSTATVSTATVSTAAVPGAVAQSGDEADLPLEAADTLEFSTDEGTWISLDVTPDGEFLIFELLGDLYRLPIEGGEAVRITEGMGYDSQPVVSPDGEWIAFISDRDGNDNLWIARVDGSDARKLSSERRWSMVSPTWSADGDYVIAVRRGPGAPLRMFHVAGGSGLTLGEDDDGSRMAPVMSPDGRHLYFAQGSSGPFRPPFPAWQIARMDMRSGQVDTITQAEGSAVRPVLSPDGEHLVYATRYETRTGLRVRNLSTGDDRWLIWPVQRDEIESGGSPSRDHFPGYAFTPDGEEVVVTSEGKIWRVDFETGTPSQVPFTADVALEIGPELEFPYRVPDGPVRARLIQDPDLSPDGGTIVTSVLTKLYRVDLAAGTPERLTDAEAWEFKPAYSPDGEWVAYVTWSMQEGGHVWRTRADGSGSPERLTSVPAFYTDIVYSPDGERIVGLRGNEYMRHRTFSEFGGLRIPLDLVWLPADGGDVELIAPARGLGAPHFGADSDRIYVYSRDGLISLRYDGTDRRTHLKVTGPARGPRPAPAEQVLMRPDGRWALAAVNNQLWVVAVPVTGNEPTVSVRSPAVPAERITDVGADYFDWADGGDTVTWAIGSTFFRRPFDSIEFAPEEEEEDEQEEGEEESEQGDGEGDGEEEEGEDEDGDAEDDEAGPSEGAQEEGEQEGEAQEGEEAEEERTPLDLHESVESIEVVVEVPRARPEGTIVLQGATVITMAAGEGGDGGVIENADLVVVDDRIAAVGPRGQVEIPAGAEEIDVSGATIVPGFIDTHAHWEFRTHDVLEPRNWSLVANLAYGVTAGLDVQTSTNDYFAYQDLVEAGMAVGQRAFMTGPGIFSSNDFRSYEATLDYLRRYRDHYRTPNIKSYMVGNRKQRQWVVKASEELELIPTTEGGRDMKLDITHAIDGFHGNEHTLPVIPLYRDVVELYARTKTAYTPTLLVQYGGPIADHFFFTREEVHDDPKLNRFYPHNRLDEMTQRRRLWARDEEFSFDEAAAQAAKIQRAGGLVGVGGHGELQGLGYHWEMWALGMGGMRPLEVLRAATIDGARIIGIEQDLGSLEAGKLADLVVLDADPRDNLRNTAAIRYVMKGGELYEGDTLDRIWPSPRPLPSFWWWDAKPEPAFEETAGR